MEMSACCSYETAAHLSSCISDVDTNSEEIVMHYPAPMEICQGDNLTPVSETHSDVCFCPRCKIQRLDSLPDMGNTSSDVSANSVIAQTHYSSLLPAHCIIEYKETCLAPGFPQDLQACKTSELNLCSQRRKTHPAHSLSDISVTSETPEKKFKTEIPMKVRDSFSGNTRSRSFYCKSGHSSSNQDASSSADISQPQSRAFLSDQILMMSCEKQLDTKEEQSVTALVLATVNAFTIIPFNYLCCKFHKHKSYLFVYNIWLELSFPHFFKEK
jgi:hypothetical protein